MNSSIENLNPKEIAELLLALARILDANRELGPATSSGEIKRLVLVKSKELLKSI